jgi:ribosomal protein S18 acetylase RimI-like enzyme
MHNVPVTVSLRPMSPEEFETAIDATFADTVREWVTTGRIAAEDAPAEIRRQRETSVPAGLDTEHMLFLIGEVEGERIGWIWLALPGAPPRHVDTAWVYNVEVDEAHRRKGYGEQLLLAAERELVQRGLKHIGLNVFGSNHGAIRLYERLGYNVISQQMAKPLTP